MKIEYEYEGTNYTANVGVVSPEETTYALIGEQPNINNLGCGFISFIERDGNVDIYVSGYSSEGKTAIFNDDAIDAVTWHYPFLTSDMLEIVPKESEVTIHSIYYATPDGMTYLNETPITLYSCSEVRIRDGMLIPSPPSPYPDVLPSPGTGAPGSGGAGGGGGNTSEHWSYKYYNQYGADHTHRTMVQANDDGLSDLFNACQLHGYRMKYLRGWDANYQVTKCVLLSESSDFIYDIEAGTLNKDGLKEAIEAQIWETRETTRLDGSTYLVQTTYIKFFCDFYNSDTGDYMSLVEVDGVNLIRDV